MRSIVLTYGLIMGFIISVLMIISLAVTDTENPDFDKAQIFGFVTMFVAFSLIFVGVKQVRDKHLGGVISFGMGTKVSGLILLIAAAMYSLTWTVYVKASDSTFYEDYYQHQLDSIEDPEELAKKTEEAEETKKRMENPIILFLFTTLEMIMPGIPFALAAAGIFRRKTPKGQQLA